MSTVVLTGRVIAITGRVPPRQQDLLVCAGLILDLLCCITPVWLLQVVKDHIKLTMTGPPTAQGEDNSPEELRDGYMTVLVARHFEAMWVHIRQGLDALPAPHHRLMDQVSCTLGSAYYVPQAYCDTFSALAVHDNNVQDLCSLRRVLYVHTSL